MWGTHKADGPKESRGGNLFVAFRGKVRNLRKLHRVKPPPPRELALTGTGVS